MRIYQVNVKSHYMGSSVYNVIASSIQEVLKKKLPRLVKQEGLGKYRLMSVCDIGAVHA